MVKLSHMCGALRQALAEKRELKREADLAPTPVAYQKYLEPLPKLSRKLRVAQPCVGMDYGEAWSVMEVGCEPCNIYDVEERYREALGTMIWEKHGVRPMLHMGKVEGDVSKARLQDLEGNVDVLVAGPPCPPWSSQGLKRAQSDGRAVVFEAVVRWVVFMIMRLGLVMVVLENVKGVLQNLGGFESFYVKLVAALRIHVPWFIWGYEALELQDYQTPQMRGRVFLRGLHRMFGCNEIPKPLPPFGRTRLSPFLARGLPNVSVDTLTQCMRRNLNWYDRQIRSAVVKGCALATDVVVCTLDRAAGKTYKPHWYVEKVPTLTCHNKYLLLMVAGEAGTPYASRTLLRFLANAERFTLQGKDPRLAELLGKQGLACKASGNAYPTALLVAVLAPMVRAIANSGVALEQPCGALITAPEPTEVVQRIFARLRVKREIKKQAPKAKARGKAKAKDKRVLKGWGSL